jgi:uridylate kinase
VKSVLIKVSGERISGASGKFDGEAIEEVCGNIRSVVDSGVGVRLVVGGGNVVRGRDFQDCKFMAAETADSVGMLSTVLNAIIMRDALRAYGFKVNIVSPLGIPFDIYSCDVFTLRKLAACSDIIIFCGGTGLPYFSTDTVAVIAAAMTRCKVLLKATKTDGIYDLDPHEFSNAQHIPELTYDDAIRRNLRVMDRTAFEIASQKKIPIYIFSVSEHDCFRRALNREIKMSVVCDA